MRTMSNDAPSQHTGNASSAPPVPVGTSDAASDSAQTKLLTDQQEAFCKAFVETNNRSLAYRRAYKVGVNTKPGTIWSNASQLCNLPHVQARIRNLLEASAAETVANKAALIRMLWDRITADRRDVINHVRRCCRYCYGDMHRYQWVDEMEYALTLAKVMDENATLPPEKHKPLPTDEGGTGFDPHREPNLTCDFVDCMGDGFGKTIIADTTKLTGGAALIYEGVKETAQGIEIKLADRNADIAQLARILGWSEEKLKGAADGSGGAAKLPDSAYEIPSTSSPEEASRRYLALVS